MGLISNQISVLSHIMYKAVLMVKFLGTSLCAMAVEEQMELHVFYAMQCKTCYSAVRVSVAGV